MEKKVVGTELGEVITNFKWENTITMSGVIASKPVVYPDYDGNDIIALVYLSQPYKTHRLVGEDKKEMAEVIREKITPLWVRGKALEELNVVIEKNKQAVVGVLGTLTNVYNKKTKKYKLKAFVSELHIRHWFASKLVPMEDLRLDKDNGK